MQKPKHIQNSHSLYLFTFNCMLTSYRHAASNFEEALKRISIDSLPVWEATLFNLGTSKNNKLYA